MQRDQFVCNFCASAKIESHDNEKKTKTIGEKAILIAQNWKQEHKNASLVSLACSATIFTIHFVTYVSSNTI